MKMKPLLLTTALVASGLCATAAGASDGTITVTGEVTSTTCTINGGTGQSFTVALPTVGTTALANSGDTAGSTPFSISLTACSVTGDVSAHFEAGTTVNAVGRLNNAGTASNVDVQLLNDSQASINLATQAGTSTATIASNAATLNYYARYYATAAASAGTVSTSVEYSIVYP